ncbi:hypothetical protein B566_EDAN008669 [Ephemera danica]|nr:hypothetical protein B566_EDAN008669 [Ephemera danica]
MRSICEAAAWPVQHDGLLGELLHVLLTPSSTAENGPLHPDYPAAETMGLRKGGDFCSTAFPACTSSPLNLVTTIASSWLT